MSIVNKVKSIVKGAKQKRTIPWWVLWDEYAAMLQGKNISREGTSMNTNFYGDLVSLYSGTNNITVMYKVSQFNHTMPVSYKAKVRMQAVGSTKISFIDHMIPHVINFQDDQLKTKVRSVQHQKDELGVSDLASLTDTYGIEENLAKFEEAYTYFYGAQRSGHAMAVLRTVIMISGERGPDFDDTVKGVEDYMLTQGIAAERVTGNIESVLKFSSPFSLNRFDDIQHGNKLVQPTVLTDEILSRMVTYSHGTASYGSMQWGTDIYSYKPILKDPKRSSTSAENWLVAAETGGGKSFFVKMLILQLLTNKNYIGTINDLEGDEYLPIVHLLAGEHPDRVMVLDMGEGVGAYFDPVEIILSGDDEQDDDMLKFSQSFVTSLFKTLVGKQVLERYIWATLIIEEGIESFYDSIGVDSTNKDTWVKTRGKTIFDIFESIKKYEVPNEEVQEAYDIVMARLNKHFGAGQGRAKLFQERIQFSDIRDAKLLLCSFGMAGKSSEIVDETTMALMQLYTASISHLRSIFAKAQGKFNFKVWEELPRWGDFPDSEKTLKTPLVGGRKLGDVNIIITNQPTELVTTDRFGIFDSITSFALGSIGNSETRKRLCEILNIEEMLPELDLLESNRVSEQKKGKAKSEYEDIIGNRYSKAFLVGIDKADYYMGKIILPEHIATSEIFMTGVAAQRDN